MTARRSMAVLAALVGSLILALLAGLWFLSGLQEREGGRGKAGHGSVRHPARPERPSVPGRSDAGTAEAATGSAAGSGDPTAPAPGSFRLEGTVLFEDGFPCSGAHFLEMLRGEDGAIDCDLDSGLDIRIESGRDGGFALSWPARPAVILLLVLCDRAEVASVENGIVAGDHEHGTVVEASGEGPLRLRTRWKPGFALVRASDPASETLYPSKGKVDGRGDDEEGRGLGAQWRYRDGKSVSAWPAGEAPVDGWIPVGLPPRREGGGPVYLEVAAVGFSTVRLPVAAVRGKVEVALRPLVPELLGDFVLPEGSRKRLPTGWGLYPAPGSEEPPAILQGSIKGPGPFAFSDVPDGRWTLEIWVLTPDGARWASRSFEKAGAAVSLGVLAATEWSGFRVRVLDTDGKPVDRPVIVEREGPGADPGRDPRPQSPGSIDGFIGTTESGGIRFVHIQDRADVEADLHVEIEPRVTGEGVEIGGLLPGAQYRLRILGPPGTSIVAEAPSARGELRAVDLRIPVHPVRCTLHFTVKGAVPFEWGEWVESWGDSDLPASGWDGRGAMNATVYPGTYEVQIRERTAEKSSWNTARGTVVVPEGETYEATVDIK